MPGELFAYLCMAKCIGVINMKEGVSAMKKEFYREIVDGNGYVLLEGLISDEKVKKARDEILVLRDSLKERGELAVEDNGLRERVHQLIYHNEVFEELVQLPDVMTRIAEVLGDDFILGGFSAHICKPGSRSLGAHVDYPYWFIAPKWEDKITPPFPSWPIMQIQMIVMLDDFTPHNGGLRVVPESQKLCRNPDDALFEKKSIPVGGKAGTVMLSHGLCWHDVVENKTDRERVSLLGNYTPKFINPIEDHSKGFKQEVLDRASPELKRMLSSQDWNNWILNKVAELGNPFKS